MSSNFITNEVQNTKEIKFFTLIKIFTFSLVGKYSEPNLKNQTSLDQISSDLTTVKILTKSSKVPSAKLTIEESEAVDP